MRVIGTAGHVDHGKSTLIAALTGTHPDRLKEEQAREMTIELGFGWMNLPNGEEVGIVDVPGHRDFIENMLAGIGGIDAALLIIAADEGLMPQTREHLNILDLLQIPGGIIVLTKTDLASDSTWLELIEADVRSAVAGTVMKDAPIVRVSAKNRTGLEELIAALSKILEEKPARPDLNRPRLPIDRVFTLSGFGTITTGTLLDGHLAVGDEVEILPSGQRGRVRGLQTHKQKEDTALPGSRTAVNISGVDADTLQRGDVVVHPGDYSPTQRLDARFRLLKDVSSPLTHSTEVKFFVGASETIATLRMLGMDELRPGEEGWIQLELRKPVITVRGDRYILRRPSPGETLGGGVVIDHQPKGRHKRFDESVLKSLASLARGSPADILFETALTMGPASIREVVKLSRLEPAIAESAFKELLENQKLIDLEEGESRISSDLIVVAIPQWNQIQAKALDVVDGYHRSFPIRRGIPREELKSRLKLNVRAFNAVIKKLVSQRILNESGSLVARAGFEIRLDAGQQIKVRALKRQFEQSPFAPPDIKACQAEVGEELLNMLIESNEFIVLSTDVILRKQDYDVMVMKIQDTLRTKMQITLAGVRDLFGTSRKYAQALLEHLDAVGMTIRDGDSRRLK